MLGLQRDGLNAWDGLLLTLLALLGGVLAWLVIMCVGSAFFYQMFTPEALMWACGHGSRHPLTLSPAMVDFLLERRTAAFDCASIASAAPTGPPGFFFRSQLYLSWTVAWLWRLLDPTQVAIAPLAAALGAGYATGAYALARLFFGRVFSTLGALALTLSPVAIGMVFMLRDFSKAPFFLWGIALLVLAARASTPRRALMLALAAGTIVGTGTGFRADLAILLPLGIGFLAVAGRLRVTLRAVAITAYGLSFLTLAAPILSVGNPGNSGFLVAQGATEPFRAFLALRPATYALGLTYSDELTLTAIAAAERPRRIDWDANEPEPIYGFSQALAYSSANLGEWAPSFAADFAAQALKGAGWLLGYPALVAVSRGSASPGSALRFNLPIVRWQEPVYALFGQPWMPLLGFIGMLALLLRVTARNGREALAAATLFLALAGYPAVQFALRHVFHLEFIWVLSMLSLPMALREWRLLLPVAPRFALATASILGAVALAYALVTHFQQSQLIAKFSALLDLPRTTVTLRRETLDDGMVLLRVPVPPAQASLIDGPPDSMNDRIAEMGIENDVRAGGERMLLMLGGATCRADTVTLELRYDHRPHIWQRLDQTLSAWPGDTIIFPAFYRATQSFAGIVLPASHSSCDVRLSRLPLTYGLPLVLTAVLAPNWRSQPLHKGLGGFDVGP